MRISDWSSDVCSSDLPAADRQLGDTADHLTDLAPGIEADRRQGADVYGDVEDQAVVLRLLDADHSDGVEGLPGENQVGGGGNRQEIGRASRRDRGCQSG